MTDLLSPTQLYELIAPELSAWERHVRETDPCLSDAEVLDHALQRAVAFLKHDLARETFVYLRWRVQRARIESQETVAASAAARQRRCEDRRDRRWFSAADGRRWTVRELSVGGAPWAQGPRCLVFEGEGRMRRVWDYPADWRDLSDPALEALSWNR